jgi:hypothetical protein
MNDLPRLGKRRRQQCKRRERAYANREHPQPHVVHKRTAIGFLRHPVSAKVGKISSNGIVAEEAPERDYATLDHHHAPELWWGMIFSDSRRVRVSASCCSACR